MGRRAEGAENEAGIGPEFDALYRIDDPRPPNGADGICGAGMGFARSPPGAEWALDSKFNAAQELLNDPKLKATIAAALKNGVEIVGAVELKMKQKPSVGLPDETRIADVDLPTRIQNVLASNGIRTIGELRKTGDDTLLRFQDLGPRSVAFIREQLRGR